MLLPGGELKAATEALAGADTVQYIRKFHFTIGFWGANGVSDQTGFTTPEVNEAMVKEVSMRQTAKRYVLCDSSKFSAVSPVTFGDFDSAVIITDLLKDSKYAKYKNIREVCRK